MTTSVAPIPAAPRPRARDLGITVGTGTPGTHNAITDVEGVLVGHCAVVRGDGPLDVGVGPVRTGVTVILPHAGGIARRPVFAGAHRLNGNGEMTGLEWVRESGTLSSPIALTNTHSVGVVRDALVAMEVASREPHELYWSLPVVAETWDGQLSDVGGQHVTADHVREAFAAAAPGPVAEGNAGSGTGMVCHGFKGGIGTASRVVSGTAGGHTVGVLVQANHGRRERLTINGAPVGAAIGTGELPTPMQSHQGGGSIISIVATDAPLLPHQCERLAQRSALGVGRTGGVGEHTSGDIMLAFSTANRITASDFGATPPLTQTVTMLSDGYIDALFDAVVEATEEAILNALLGAATMTGRDGHTAHALPAERLVEVLGRHDAMGPAAG
jgi:D-aminopeptidase